ncbi:hypothetical protein [Oerskovia merdavium]|uniref:DUF402 domain-containing protein n=1 Tax=Oerskovia merdavium TaxID=2762227 RepID=A0ABR8U3Y3_9CELL|nr:hypothetical protein [Oerskovia merdavium]MBD7982746.1 hypothetical protein [Oerskovia merdavium]
MSDDTWGAEFFRIPDIAWQTQAPPDRHAIPARYIPDLATGDELTIGLPGKYFIDGQILARTDRSSTTLPGQGETHEALGIAAPFAYWLAKTFPRAGITMQWWPLAHAWAYRDAIAPSSDDDAPIASPAPQATPGALSWLDGVRSSLTEPPMRRPRPAREAGALTGRTVRLQHEPGAWSWWIAVSEPVDIDGEITVRLMQPEHYWLTQVLYETDGRSQPVPLHRLFIYS